jgi:hypothetical protein
MKVTLESTTKIVQLNGVPARVWEGQTESGVKIHCFITRVAIDKDEPRAEEFERELQEQRVPSPEIEAFPTRMII